MEERGDPEGGSGPKQSGSGSSRRLQGLQGADTMLVAAGGCVGGDGSTPGRLVAAGLHLVWLAIAVFYFLLVYLAMHSSLPLDGTAILLSLAFLSSRPHCTPHHGRWPGVWEGHLPCPHSALCLMGSWTGSTMHE